MSGPNLSTIPGFDIQNEASIEDLIIDKQIFEKDVARSRTAAQERIGACSRLRSNTPRRQMC